MEFKEQDIIERMYKRNIRLLEVTETKRKSAGIICKEITKKETHTNPII